MLLRGTWALSLEGLLRLLELFFQVFGIRVFCRGGSGFSSPDLWDLYLSQGFLEC